MASEIASFSLVFVIVLNIYEHLLVSASHWLPIANMCANISCWPLNLLLYCIKILFTIQYYVRWCFLLLTSHNSSIILIVYFINYCENYITLMILQAVKSYKIAWLPINNTDALPL